MRLSIKTGKRRIIRQDELSAFVHLEGQTEGSNRLKAPFVFTLDA